MCEYCDLFNLDAPFRFHRPDSKTKEVLIGNKKCPPKNSGQKKATDGIEIMKKVGNRIKDIFHMRK